MTNGKISTKSLLSTKDLVPGSLAKINSYELKLPNLDQVWNAKFTKSKLHKACMICGSTDNIEMHHVRAIRDLKQVNSKLDFFTRQMMAINRKQIPLCHAHHSGLHANT